MSKTVKAGSTGADVTVATGTGNTDADTQRVVLASDQPAVPVTGTFYQATQPISAASLPLPTGAATAAKQPALGTAGSASADVLSVQGVASMTALKVDGSGVTQPASLASLPALAAGSAIVGKVGIDQTTPGTTNAVAATNLPTTIDTNSGTKSSSTLRVVLATDQPALTNKLLVTPDSVALPAHQSVNVDQINGSTIGTAATGVQKVGVVGSAGAAVDSTVAAGTAPTNQVVTGSVYNTSAPAPTNGQAMAQQADQSGNLKVVSGIATATLSAWNSSTALNATQTVFTNAGCDAVLVHLVQTTTLSAGAVTFEISYDGANWVTVPASCVLDPSSTAYAQIAVPYTVQANTNKPFLIVLNGAQALRAKLSTQITGSGTVTPNYALLNLTPVMPTVPVKPGTGTQSIVAGSGSDGTILAANANRMGGTVYNDSTAILYLLLANTTSSATVYTTQLQPYDYYEIPFGYTGVLKGLWSSATGNARVTEFTA